MTPPTGAFLDPIEFDPFWVQRACKKCESRSMRVAHENNGAREALFLSCGTCGAPHTYMKPADAA